MARLVAYTCLLMYFIGLLRPVAPLIEFELKKDYIRNVLCLKKDEPITVCGGRCYLKNKLEKSVDNQEERSHVIISLDDYPIGFVYFFDFDHYSDHSLTSSATHSQIYSFLFSFTIHRPPKA